ncbi:MAG: hypothetical protein ACTS5I_05220, partial [Rhodanobacter sp.]
VLGLHAPKARFQSSLANTFFALPFINGNLLEAMGTRKPFPSALKLPDFSNFVADQATGQARAIARELRELASSGAYPDVVLVKAMAVPFSKTRRLGSAGLPRSECCLMSPSPF